MIGIRLLSGDAFGAFVIMVLYRCALDGAGTFCDWEIEMLV